MKTKMMLGLSVLLLAVLGVATACGGGEEETTTVSFVATQPLVGDPFQIEKDHMTRVLSEVSDGKLIGEVTQINEVGLTGFELVRVLQNGGYNTGEILGSYVSGDVPLAEGMELVGIYSNFDQVRRSFKAFLPVVSEELETKFNIKALSAFGNAPNVVWCKPGITDIDSLAGRKVRVFGTSLADFMTAVGAQPVTITYAEVYGSLERGVVDCAVTQIPGANKNRWPEVVTTLFPLPLVNPAPIITVNLDFWEGLSDSKRDWLRDTAERMAAANFDSEESLTEDAQRCTVGQSPCEKHNRYNLTLVEPSQADLQRMRDISRDVILPKWVARCGADCKQKWNDTIGDVVGIQIP